MPHGLRRKRVRARDALVWYACAHEFAVHLRMHKGSARRCDAARRQGLCQTEPTRRDALHAVACYARLPQLAAPDMPSALVSLCEHRFKLREQARIRAVQSLCGLRRPICVLLALHGRDGRHLHARKYVQARCFIFIYATAP
jgi:hypothetical protein